MDPAVWDYIFDKYNRPAEAPTRPLAPDLVESTSKAHSRKRDASATRTLIAQHPKRVKADAMSTAPRDSHIDHDVVQGPSRKRGATITGISTIQRPPASALDLTPVLRQRMTPTRNVLSRHAAVKRVRRKGLFYCVHVKGEALCNHEVHTAVILSAHVRTTHAF